VARIESGKPLGREARLPRREEARAAAQLAHFFARGTFIKQQDQPPNANREMPAMKDQWTT
jgi:hypothetical protein